MLSRQRSHPARRQTAELPGQAPTRYEKRPLILRQPKRLGSRCRRRCS
jgi:hypothetical protein